MTDTNTTVNLHGSPLFIKAYRAARDGGLAVSVDHAVDGRLVLLAKDDVNGGWFKLTMTPGLTRPSHSAVRVSRQGAQFSVMVSAVQREIARMVEWKDQRAAATPEPETETVQEDTMNTTPETEAARQDAVARFTQTPAAYDLKAARRWINECYEGAASCHDWTTAQVLEWVADQHVDGLEAFRRYRFYATYQQATPAARAAVDVVFGAVAETATPHMGVSLDKDGRVGAGFSLPGTDPDEPVSYLVDIDPEGRLDRLRKLVRTGRWIDNGEGELEPDVSWVTITRFSQDPAGKLFKHSRAAAYAPQTAAWMDVVTR